MAPQPPIAIIGMSCRLPGGAHSPSLLWDLLAANKSAHGPVPPSRWNSAAFQSPDNRTKESLLYNAAHFLTTDVAAFDARFFRMPARDVAALDPQQRLLLEVAYEAFENAGIPVESLRGTDAAVFLAEFVRDWTRMTSKDLPEMSDLHVVGSGDALLANRISYAMDLRGPSMVLDTGCSGSLVAVHQACLSLASGDCSIALAGGCQLILSPDQSMPMSQVRMNNADGKCYVWDDRGDGYGRGEGCGIVVLKRLDDALRDGDEVQAVIAGSGVNQDGKTNGIMLPSTEAQAALARSIYKKAGLNPADTLYVEAHGTGTQAGDRVELSGIRQVFCDDVSRTSNLRVGSLKANIGHLECASGIAALIKAVMVLKHGLVPANINLITPKPTLPLEGAALELNTETVPLAIGDMDGTRRVSVNSFGYGGTNAHLILEEPSQDSRKERPGPNSVKLNGTSHSSNGVPSTNGRQNGHPATNGVTNGGPISHSHRLALEQAPNGVSLKSENLTNGHTSSSTTPPPQLIILSAACESSLAQMASNLRQWSADRDLRVTQLRDLAYTLSARRSLHSWRASLVASNSAELISRLGEMKPKQTAGAPNITFVFTGQGAQWFAMGRELLQQGSSVFAQSIRECDALLASYGAQWSLEAELLRDAADTRLNESEISQPATTAVQIALVDMLAELGLVPNQVCGHSSGEIAAAYAAGALSKEAAIKASYMRGIFSKKAILVNTTRGSMVATGLGEDAVRPYIKLASQKGKVVVACINSPSSTTVSGDETGIDELLALLTRDGVFCRKLKVDTAYHSHHMEAVAAEYQASINDETQLQGSPREGTAFFSSVTGCRKTDGFGPEYWATNLVSPVQFDKALRTVAEHASSESGSSSAGNVLVEMGPHSALSGPARQILSPDAPIKTTKPFKYEYLSPLVRNKDALETTLQCLGRLFEAGAPIALNKLTALSTLSPSPKPKLISDLPPYPWDHSSTYWGESRLSSAHRFRRFPYHDMIGVLDVISNPAQPRWRHHIDPDAIPWVRDHVVDGAIVFPGTGFLSMAMEALNQHLQIRDAESGKVNGFTFRDVRFTSPLVIPERSVDKHGAQPQIEIQITLTPDAAGGEWEMFRVASYEPKAGEDTYHATGQWVEHCSGYISAQMADTDEDFDAQRLDDLTTAEQVRLFEKISGACETTADPKKLYEDLADCGNVFGPSFRSLVDMRTGPHMAFARAKVPDIEGIMPSNHLVTAFAHAATLDSFNHPAAAVFREHYSTSPFVLAVVEEMRVSASMSRIPGAELLVVTRLDPDSSSKRSALGRVWAYQRRGDGGELELVSELSGRLQVIGEDQVTDEDDSFTSSRIYKMEWNVDVDHLSNDAFQKHLDGLGLSQPEMHINMSVEDTLFFRNTAALIHIRKAVRGFQTSSLELDQAQWHLAKVFSWMRRFAGDLAKEIDQVNDTRVTANKGDISAENYIIQQCEASGPTGAMLNRVGRELVGILTGAVPSLGLIFNDNLIERVYATEMMASYSQLDQYLRPLSFKRPQMRILEVGAGTGGATMHILPALTDPVDGLLFDRYCYTDVSSGFFEKAKVKFAQWVHRMDFQLFDASSGPETQAKFWEYLGGDNDETKFDLIVAANVLHATPDLQVTLSNCRKLLRPGGRLALIEATELSPAYNTIFGMLEGWWMSTDFRRDADTPCVSPEDWDRELKRSGFSGLDISASDHSVSSTVFSMMISTAIETAKEPLVANGHAENGSVSTRDTPGETITILVKDPSDAATLSLVAELTQQLKGSEQHFSLTRVEFAQALEEEGENFIVLDMAHNSLLQDPTAAEFATIQKLTTSSSRTLWATFHKGATSTSTSALSGMVQGLARVANHENPLAQFTTLDVRDSVDDQKAVSAAAEAIFSLIASILCVPTSSSDSNAPPPAQDHEFALENGQLLIPRLRIDGPLNTWTASTRAAFRTHTVAPASFLDASRPLTLEVGTPGLLSSLRFTDDTALTTPLAPYEIELRPVAYGINFRDVYVALGQAPPGSQMAGEVAGVVTAVGEEMKERYQVGDRVAGMQAQGYCSRPRFHGLCGYKMPDEMTFAEGASAVAVYATAWHCLVDIARLEKGESILIR